MAKASKIARNEQRRAVVARYAQQRAALQRTVKDPATPEAERLIALRALQRMPRDASPTRLRRRDAIDGRPRGHLSRFGISRVRFREMAHHGELPGVRTSSW
ncbi:30S ribosomal protein S14 [Brachybacterium sp. EF45031]|uniref:30S ribosomal protein S14 n=1 Tax=Brachybacterium sillae TaxID=2810536 RepID=UPI00217EEF30|nr:30S ribosomal protein S14 [Brachybacterium sillae]MCS6712024.1 30S ribosomal protein S14 [Brachybacterium sillae]